MVDEDVVVGIAVEVGLVVEVRLPQGCSKTTVLCIVGEEHHMPLLAQGNV